MFRSAFLKRIPLFVRNLSENVLLCLLAAAVESTSKRVLETVVLDWRQTLTNRIHKLYFDNMVIRRPESSYLLPSYPALPPSPWPSLEVDA
jgi:hypothetical protein